MQDSKAERGGDSDDFDSKPRLLAVQALGLV